jgi:leucine dehydrogenase
MFNHPSFDAHERVVFGHDASSGLRAIVALHSTMRGPAAGGCRFWHYDSPDEALTDALRLSRGMSYKNAMADLPLGGGKAVVLLDQTRAKTPELLRAFGRLVNSLSGAYITAEDVGATVADMEIVATETPYVSGLPCTAVSADGNPAPKTAFGVYLGLKAAVEFQFGRPELRGLTIAVQGVGNVGFDLCRRLAADGADLLVADVSKDRVERAVRELGARAVDSSSILEAPADVLAPCALGAVLNAASIPRLKAKVVAGAANNQLATPEDGTRMFAAGILYAPDYVINAGGIISVGREYLGGATAESIDAEIRKIPERLLTIFERSRRERRATSEIADEMARERIGR